DSSIAIRGVCETVVAKKGTVVDVVAVEETLKKTTLGNLTKGSKVNLELPIRFNERLGGHLVLGHVDSFGSVIGIEQRSTSWMFSVKIPKPFLKYVVPIGSIAVDGVSLTIAELKNDIVRISIIPHTMEHTIFGSYQSGTEVNLEFDIVGKYIERFTMLQDSQSRPDMFTERNLREMGF
ncbi:MAG TPA: riboflavin synthase, partial [Bacteroidota bacterium]|nr:riboflavin synthase [Bacteroidota bacterium]